MIKFKGTKNGVEVHITTSYYSTKEPWIEVWDMQEAYNKGHELTNAMHDHHIAMIATKKEEPK